MNFHNLFSWKNEKKMFKMSSAELAKSVVKVDSTRISLAFLLW